MATLQHLSNRQINEVIEMAAGRRVPVTITIRAEKGWASYRSRMLAIREGHIWLELPRDEPETCAHDFSPADKAGVSFKLKHHKHVFTGTVAGVDSGKTDDGCDVQILRVCSPTKMHRMQRRAFFRAEVPPNRIVRASFWPGGREAEPAGTTPERPVWSGRVANLSAGGLQVRCEDIDAEALEIGETVGIRISFGAGDETVYADAQFRHIDVIDDGALVGLQFVGLPQTPEGRQVLQFIGTKASEYQRELAAQQRAN